MSPRPTLLCAALIISSSPHLALAADEPASSDGATGSGSVLIEGQPAKRAGDIPGAIISPNVMINGQPVIVGCTEGVPILSKSVFVNGKPKILGCQK